ncbi:Rieske 2Fe-2S domain-containing protein [Anaerobacillus sp. HL2]|nr:Rieske 2Fe-2S domain-containing protein [Anaerobacillus sp. HL2]
MIKAKKRIEIAKLSDLPKGESVTFYYPTESDPALLIHTVNGDLKAYNSACTHLMCPVFYENRRCSFMSICRLFRC